MSKVLDEHKVYVKEKNPGKSELKVVPDEDNKISVEQADAEIEAMLKRAVEAKLFNPSKKQSKGNKPRDKKKAKIARASRKANRKK